MSDQKRYSIAEVERLMQQDDVHLDIKPDGEIVATQLARIQQLIPLTRGIDLPSNY